MRHPNAHDRLNDRLGWFVAYGEEVSLRHLKLPRNGVVGHYSRDVSVTERRGPAVEREAITGVIECDM